MSGLGCGDPPGDSAPFDLSSGMVARPVFPEDSIRIPSTGLSGTNNQEQGKSEDHEVGLVSCLNDDAKRVTMATEARWRDARHKLRHSVFNCILVGMSKITVHRQWKDQAARKTDGITCSLLIRRG